MTDTTVGYSAAVADGVAAYVREVRAELADLPAEDVEDVTGGMEADLSELASEFGGDLVGRLGSPSLYAAELRCAAGLPERLRGSDRRRRPWHEALAHARDSITILTRDHPWLGSVMAFLVTLRPAWWLLRGYLAAWALWSMLSGNTRGVRPHSFLEGVLALGGIVLSVQLGRGWLRRRPLLAPLVAVVNTALVVVALVASVSVDGSYDSVSSYSPPPGVSLNGGQVGNIYPYGSDGKRLTGVRLFAADGQPLDGEPSFTDANGNSVGFDAFGQPVGVDVNGNPSGAVQDGSGAWLLNVYPRALAGSDPWYVTKPAGAQPPPSRWTPPASIAPLISAPMPTATATATGLPTVSASPRSSGRPSPSVTPSGR